VIDVNVSLSRWPFRRLVGDEPAELVSRLRRKGVTQAWAGSFDGLLHRDIAAVNTRLAADCRAHGPGFLVPFGTVNPKLPDWADDLRRCHEEHRMPGIRLHPNYHGYKLDEPVLRELLTMAAARKLLVQIALAMEDDRTQNPIMRVPPVDPAPLQSLARDIPNLKLILLNGNRIPGSRELAQTGKVYFDIAMVEAVAGVGRLASEVSPGRVVFGSHFPFYYLDSAILKTVEAALPEDQLKAVVEGNARALLESKG